MTVPPTSNIKVLAIKHDTLGRAFLNTSSMAVRNEIVGGEPDLRLDETTLDSQERLDRTAHGSGSTERTSLLWKPTSTSNASANEELISFADIEASCEHSDGRSGWLVKIFKFTVTMMAGVLPLLPYWMLIAFLFAFLK